MQLFLISLLLLSVSLGEASPTGLSEEKVKMKLERGGCPPFWFRFNGRCYKYVATDLNWPDAELHCLSQGANLVSIHSLEENNFVKDLIANFDHAQGITWIGLTDIQKEGAWMWSDGSKVGFTKWNRGEPNNAGFEGCVHINWGEETQWNDFPCDRPQPSVCKARLTCLD